MRHGWLCNELGEIEIECGKGFRAAACMGASRRAQESIVDGAPGDEGRVATLVGAARGCEIRVPSRLWQPWADWLPACEGSSAAAAAAAQAVSGWSIECLVDVY